MKNLYLFLALAFLAACNTSEDKKGTPTTIETVMPPDNARVSEGQLPSDSAELPNGNITATTPDPDEYGNQRFRKVRAEKLSENKYRITGEGQIFEANFGWVIEDGHNELAKGHQMTDAGTWYEIARLPNRFEKGLECITATYTVREDGKINVLNKGNKANDLTKTETVAVGPNLTASFKLQIELSEPSFLV